MNDKGFTLIELLAVLIILGVLALLITPKIITTLNEAEKNTNLASAKELVKAAEYKYSNSDMVGETETVTINYTKNSNVNYLDYKGDKPEDGQITIRDNGLIAMAVRFGDYCYVKAYNKNDIEVIPYNNTTCGKNAYVFVNVLDNLPEVVTSGDGLYASPYDEGRYIYRGVNPNNYIWLDENGDEIKQDSEMYRIISFEADGTVKVIKDKSIGNIAWDVNEDNSSYKLPWATDTSVSLKKRPYDADTVNPFCNTIYGCNVWGNLNTTYLGDNILSTVMDEYKYKYYQDNKPETLLKDHPNNGVVDEEASLNILLNNYWYSNLSDGLKDSIVNHSYNVGGLYYYNGYNGGDKGIEREKDEISTYTWNGKIALMDITDMVDTSINFGCTSVYSNYYYNNDYWYDANDDGEKTQNNSNWPCTNNNWLFKGITEWSLSAYSSIRYYVWIVSSAGYFSISNANNASGVRPAFYLKSSIQLAGYGTYDEPYTIYLEDELE